MQKLLHLKSSRLIFSVGIFILLIIPRLEAGQSSDDAVKANIIYHFTKYIDWPESKKSGDFVIGILGDPHLYDKLKIFLTGKTVGEQKIIIKKIDPSDRATDCHILYIGEAKSNSIRTIASTTAAASVLLVTEKEGLAAKGSCINFVVVADHLKLEINKDNIEKRGLSIASELVKLGKLIK